MFQLTRSVLVNRLLIMESTREFTFQNVEQEQNNKITRVIFSMLYPNRTSSNSTTHTHIKITRTNTHKMNLYIHINYRQAKEFILEDQQYVCLGCLKENLKENKQRKYAERTRSKKNQRKCITKNAKFIHLIFNPFDSKMHFSPLLRLARKYSQLPKWNFQRNIYVWNLCKKKSLIYQLQSMFSS